MNQFQSMIAANIASHGWHGQAVFGGGEPSYNYSIGLSLRGLPELMVIGLPPERGHLLISYAIDLMDGKVLADRTVTTELAQRGFRTAFCDLDSELTCERYAIQAREYLGHAPFFQQLVWADTENILPFEAGCEERMAAMQCGVRDYRKEA